MIPATKQTKAQRTKETQSDRKEDKQVREKQIIVIDKSGTLKDVSIKDVLNQNETQQKNTKKEEEKFMSELYKKAGLKSGDGFEEQFIWELEYEEKKYLISLYAKKTGRVQNKNLYSFPPPFEESSFYGNCVLVSSDSDLTSKLWESLFELVYEKYDDEEEDIDEEDESLEDNDLEDDTEEEEEEQEEEEQEEEGKKISKGGKKREYKKHGSKGQLIDDPVVCFADVVENFLDCSSELEMEKYI
jgi:hypothetical protein